MNTEHIIKEANEYLVPFYSRFSIAVVKGDKHWLWDAEGKKYLDFATGIAVVSFGHNNKKINNAIKKQLDKVSHISNLYYIPEQIELAKLLCSKAFDGKAFFCNSGAEANESALKMARIYGNSISPNKNKVLSVSGSFHGRTVATISLTGQEKYKKGFEPLLTNIKILNFNSIDDLVSNVNGEVCAIFLEAIQGEGGINPLTKEYVRKVKELAEKYNFLVIFDEVQAGIGRTGKYFGYQHYDITPDMITMAKALGNGMPIGCVLVKNSIADKMPSGMHASTFGGNYLACSAGIAVLNELNEKMLSNINNISAYFKDKLEMLQGKYPTRIKEIRIFGLMIGIDIQERYKVSDIINSLIEEGILTLRAGANVLRLMPPFTITEKECDLFIDKLDKVLSYL